MGKNEEARKRLAAAMKKAEPPTREEQIAARIQELEAIPGLGRQAMYELGWLRELQKRDAIQAEMDAGGREIADLRAQYTAARKSLKAIQGERTALQGVPADQLLERVRAEQAAFSEASALATVVSELKRRISDAQAAQRARTQQYNQVSSLVIQLKNRAGL